MCQAFDQLHIFPDVLFCQEVGSISSVGAGDWAVKEFSPKGHPAYTAFVFDPQKSFRGTAIIVRQQLAENIRHIRATHTGGSLSLRIHGINLHLHGIHLPHLKREDALQVRQDQFAELRLMHSGMRHHDLSVLAGDWNHNLSADCDGSEFSVLGRSFLQEQGYVVSHPSTVTWTNHAGSSAIDFVCVRSPSIHVLHDEVRWDCPEVLPSDHSLIDFSFVTDVLTLSCRKRLSTQCGRWHVKTGAILQAADSTDGRPRIEGSGPFRGRSLAAGIPGVPSTSITSLQGPPRSSGAHPTQAAG